MVWNRTSVSQYKTYTECPKKWYLNKIAGITQPATAATEFGGFFHEFLEKCANEKKYPKTHENDVINHIIKKNTEFMDWLVTLKDKKIEEEMNIVLPVSKVPMLGYIDLSYTKQAGIVFVEDYKTCSSWRYTLTDETLGDDIQMNIYGAYKKATFLAHHQFNKKTCSMRTVRVPFNATKGEEALARVDLAAISMKKDSIKKVEEIDENRNSCKNYGGCPYKEYCKGSVTLEELKFSMDNPFFKEDRSKEEVKVLSPDQRLEEIEKELKFNKTAKAVKMNIQEKLKMLKAKQNKAIDDEKIPVPEKAKEVEKEETPKPKAVKKKKEKAVVVTKPLVLVGCIEHNNNLPTASEILEPFIEQVLKKYKVSTLVAIPYNEGIKDLSISAETLLEKLKEVPAFRLEVKLPVDSLIFTLIFQLKQESQFTIIRNVF